MSADNWTICPRCEKKYSEPLSQYGKVSEEEYLKLREEKNPELEETLREDYHIGTDEDGNFSVGYYCSCDKCGFKFQYKYEEQLKV